MSKKACFSKQQKDSVNELTGNLVLALIYIIEFGKMSWICLHFSFRDGTNIMSSLVSLAVNTLIFTVSLWYCEWSPGKCQPLNALHRPVPLFLMLLWRGK